jgi:hypothetical protein
MFQLGDSFLRRVHRNHANWSDAIGVFRPGFRSITIKSPTPGQPQFFISDVRRKQLRCRRIQNREI